MRRADRENSLADLAGSIAYPGVDFSGNLDLTPFLPPASPVSAQEGAENIATALDTAISSSRPLRLSSDFSGGLDSTILGLVAAKDRAASNQIAHGFVQFTAYTSGGDLQYARKFAKHGAITLHELQGGDEVLPFAKAAPASLFEDGAYRGYAIYAREQQRLEAITLLGTGMQQHLHGNGGDALFDPNPQFIMSDLLAKGATHPATALAHAYAKAKLQNPENILRQAREISESTLADSYQRIAYGLRTEQPPDSSDWLPRSQSTHWLTPEIRELLANRADHMAGHCPRYVSAADYAIAQSIHDSHDAHNHLQKLADLHNISLHVPYLDNAVVSSVLAVPASERIAAGQYRPLMLNAARHILGEEVADILSSRQSKTSYDMEMRAGIKNDLKRRENSIILRQIGTLGRLGIIDVDVVQKAVFNCSVHPNFPFNALAQLVSIGASLEQHAKDLSGPLKRRPSAAAERAEKSLPPHYHLAENYYVQREDHLIVAHPNPDNTDYVFTALNSQSGLILRQLAEGKVPRAIISHEQKRYPEISANKIAQDIRTGYMQLEKFGIIFAAHTPASVKPQLPPGSTTTTMPVAIQEEKRRVRTQDYVLSAAEQSIAEQALANIQRQQEVSFNIPAIIAAMNLSKANLKSATVQQAQRALEMAHAITKDVKDRRIACLTLSLLAVEVLKQQGLAVDWSIGVHPLSPDFHAWIEAEGTRIVSASDDSPEAYLPFFRA